MAETSIVEMTVARISPYLSPDRPLLWLSEKNAEHARLLPIAIGKFEASAIHMELNAETPPRPISYDLFTSMLQDLQAGIRQIVIHTVRNQVFFAKILIEKDNAIREIDARPSDAVALAVRTGSPIFVTTDLLQQAGMDPLLEEDIELTVARFHDMEVQFAVEKGTVHVNGPNPEETATADTAHSSPLGQLQAQLDQAIVCEEYEEAARLRDAIEQHTRDGDA